MDALDLDPTVQRALFSSPAHIVGEYVSEDLKITHAFVGGEEVASSYFENPFARSYYVAAFQTDPLPRGEAGFVYPNWSPFADALCSVLSVLFGKAFRYHGMMEEHGHHLMPRGVQPVPNPFFRRPPYSSQVRLCVATPLNLSEFARMRPLVDAITDDAAGALAVLAACRLYTRALLQVSAHPDLAYLDLVTAGEVIAGQRSVPEANLYDDETKKILAAIENGLADGKKTARQVRNRLFQVRRRFAFAIADCLDGHFYANHEASNDGLALKLDDTRERLLAAYDLRSNYVHSGLDFGAYVTPLGAYANEVPMGQWHIGDASAAKAINKAPTLLGLERVIRYALVRLAVDHGAHFADVLGAPADPPEGDGAKAPAAEGGDA